MNKYFKVKVRPLTNLHSLGLHIVEEKHYDLIELPDELKKELLNQLMVIVQKSEKGIVAKNVAGKPAVAAVMKSAKNRKNVFSFPEPNPIHLYYRIAIAHLEKAERNLKVFYDIQYVDTTEEFQAFCDYFDEVAQGIIFLLMTVEGFLNQLPEDGEFYNIGGKEKSKKDLEWMNLTDKLRDAVPALTGLDIQATARPVYDKLQFLNDLRNDLVHLKTIKRENFTYYQDLFKRLLDFPTASIAAAVFAFINLIRPGSLTEDIQQSFSGLLMKRFPALMASNSNS